VKKVKKSRPARARGLKHVLKTESIFFNASRPARARGLKPHPELDFPLRQLSRPARARGLKHNDLGFLSSTTKVAPRAGAWIETPMLI